MASRQWFWRVDEAGSTGFTNEFDMTIKMPEDLPPKSK